MTPIEGLRVEFVPLTGEPPAMEARGYLCAEEEAAFRLLSAPKRRRDWLGGRLAAKLALAKELDVLGIRRGLNEIAIGNNAEGAPTWRLLRPAAAPAWPLSITHSGSLAGAALHTLSSRLGVDVEQIEERHSAWDEVAFHPEERPAAATAEAATRLWTVKEAVLKVLGLGLRADLWDVRAGAAGIRLFGRALQRWRALGEPELSISTHQVDERHVLSVAHAGGTPEPLARAAHREAAWIR